MKANNIIRFSKFVTIFCMILFTENDYKRKKNVISYFTVFDVKFDLKQRFNKFGKLKILRLVIHNTKK